MTKQMELAANATVAVQETNESLCQLIQEGQQWAQLALIQRNTGLIHAMAWRERRKYSYLQVEMEDLWAAGQMGLLRAARMYQPTGGTAFVTYAWSHVRQAIQREIVRGGTMIRIPVHLHDRLHKIALYRDSLYATDCETLASRITQGEKEGLGLTTREVYECLTQAEPAIQVRSLNEPLSQEVEREREETVCDTQAATPDQVTEVKLLVSGCLDCLTRRERQVIALRYGLEDGRVRTLAEAGKELEISKERVRQLEKQAMEKMRAWITRE